jgi:hypothetical protein
MKLTDLGFWNTPMGARPVTGARDELGNPVYQDVAGNQFNVMPAPAQEQGPGLLDMLAGIYRLAGGRGSEQDKAAATGLLGAVTQGLTAPGRAAQGEMVTNGDVWSTALDYGAMGAPMAAPEGAIRAGAVATEARTAAQNVADLLRQGRASEVTDAMMAQVDPQEMWGLYESGATGMEMPMDQASRMVRAQDMGFDTGTPLYHGTGADFQAFDPAMIGAREPGWYGSGYYSTAAPDLASEYVASARFDTGGQPNVIPVNVRRGQEYVWGSNPVAMTRAQSREFRDNLSNLGYDGVRVPNDYGGDLLTPTEAANYEVVTFDPRNLRSLFARFDPRLAHLGNLSAGVAGLLYAAPNGDQGQGN